jgi:hypothetical protein
MRNLIIDIDCSLTGPTVSSTCAVNMQDVKSIVSHLKRLKSDGCTLITSDCIIYAGDEFMVHLALLFIALLVHCTAPDNFQLSTIIPIPKGHNLDKSDSNNFRDIVLSSIFGKMLDNIILDRYPNNLMSCELQFGFKANCSINLCTMALKETGILRP